MQRIVVLCYAIWLLVSIEHKKEPSVGILNIFLTAVLFISGFLTIILILMHSGKGTGVSDMIASSVYNASVGSGILEKNLDRLTIITTTIFMLTVIVMAIVFPTGTI